MRRLLPILVALLALPVAAEAECIGEGDYRVCTESYTDSRDDTHIRSHDTMGNTYSVDTETRSYRGNGHEITSRDSMGNSYSVKSWSDSTGTHSIDSMGNRCTITRTGQVIGCGQ